MIVGFDAKRAFSNTRGLGNYSRNLISGLLQYYPQNKYVLFADTPRNQSLKNWYSSIKNETRIESPAYGNKLYGALWRSFFMRKNIAKVKPDIYHGLSHELPLGMDKSKGTKYIVTVHDLLFMRFKSNFSAIDRAIYQQKIQYSCKKADVVLAISEQTKSDLINFLHVPEEKIQVVYQSCSPLFYAQATDEQKDKIRSNYDLPPKYLLYVGALVKHKNIERIIEALQQIPSEMRIPLVIIGKPNAYKIVLQNKISTLKLEHDVIFIDFVELEELPAIYQMAEILVWPSLFEGFGIPIIEALFSGLPVITSREGCFPEVGGKAAFYVNPNNSEEISKAIEKILSDKKLYANMQKTGYEQASKFHIATTTEKLMQLYSSL